MFNRPPSPIKTEVWNSLLDAEDKLKHLTK